MFDHILFDKKVVATSSYLVYSYGNIRAKFVFITSPNMSIVNADGDISGGNSGLVGGLTIETPLSINIDGNSIFTVLRLGDTNLELFHLEDLELLPGETITIDTDLLIVLFGETHNVSSVTNDSRFFELGKGSNGFSFYVEFVPDGPSDDPIVSADDELDLTFIWQNRWL